MDPFKFRIGCKYFFLGYLPRSTDNLCQSVVGLPIVVTCSHMWLLKWKLISSNYLWLVATALDSENRIFPSLQKGLLYSFDYSMCNSGLVAWTA